LIATPFTSTMADLKRAVDAVADQKHVEQLKKGVAECVGWRRRDRAGGGRPHTRP